MTFNFKLRRINYIYKSQQEDRRSSTRSTENTPTLTFLRSIICKKIIPNNHCQTKTKTAKKHSSIET